MTFLQAHASPDRALEGPRRPSAAGNGIPPASLSQPACHPTRKPPSRHTHGSSLSRRRGKALGFRITSRGPWERCPVERDSTRGQRSFGGSAAARSTQEGWRGWRRPGRVGPGRGCGGRRYLARGTAVTPGPLHRELPAGRARRTARAEGQTAAARARC